MYRQIQYIHRHTKITSMSLLLLFSGLCISMLYPPAPTSASSLTQLVPIQVVPRVKDLLNYPAPQSSSSNPPANNSGQQPASTPATPSTETTATNDGATTLEKKSKDSNNDTASTTQPNPKPTVPVGLVVNLFNSTTTSGTLGLISASANPDSLNTDVDQENTTKNTVTSLGANDFSWYWDFLGIAAIVAVYYGYRNWQLSKE